MHSILALLTSLLAIFIACGSSPPSKEEPTGSAQAHPTELEIDDDSIAISRLQAAFDTLSLPEVNERTCPCTESLTPGPVCYRARVSAKEYVAGVALTVSIDELVCSTWNWQATVSRGSMTTDEAVASLPHLLAIAMSQAL